jgi:hypothetical protein
VLRIRIADEKGNSSGYSTKKIRIVSIFDDTCRRHIIPERWEICIMPMQRKETARMNGDDVGGKPPHFDRLRRRWVSMEAVEAKCGGCERSLLSRWRG